MSSRAFSNRKTITGRSTFPRAWCWTTRPTSTSVTSITFPAITAIIPRQGVPYGAGSEEHAVTATLTRRISKNMRLSVKYGYYPLRATRAYGGNRDFGANLISATLRYRF